MNGSWGDTQRAGDLGVRQLAEVVQHDQFAGLGVELSNCVQKDHTAFCGTVINGSRGIGFQCDGLRSTSEQSQSRSPADGPQPVRKAVDVSEVRQVTGSSCKPFLGRVFCQMSVVSYTE